MRHQQRGRKLNRTPSHRKAMVRNLVTSLFLHGRVQTTPAKAKEARPFAEKLITLAKRGDLHARRRAISLLHDPGIVKSLFEEIGPRYRNRPGGYCRILHSAYTRVGDRAPQVIFELVEEEMRRKAATVPTVSAPSVAPSTAPTVAAPAAEAETSITDASAEATAKTEATAETEASGEADAPADATATDGESTTETAEASPAPEAATRDAPGEEENKPEGEDGETKSE